MTRPVHAQPGRDDAPPRLGPAGVRSYPPMALPRLRTFAYASWVVVAVLAIWAVVAWTRQAHAMTPWSLRPERISYCDRDYQRNPAWVVVSGKELRDLRVGTGPPSSRSDGSRPYSAGRFSPRRQFPSTAGQSLRALPGYCSKSATTATSPMACLEVLEGTITGSPAAPPPVDTVRRTRTTSPVPVRQSWLPP